MAWFKAARLHRKRRHRRRGETVHVLDEQELCLFFSKPREELTQELERLAWPYHRDAADQIWASVPNEALKQFLENADTPQDK